MTPWLLRTYTLSLETLLLLWGRLLGVPSGSGGSLIRLPRDAVPRPVNTLRSRAPYNPKAFRIFPRKSATFTRASPPPNASNGT
jgi:hypothetical protein